MHEVGKRLVQYGYSVKLICERWAGSAKVESLDGIEIVRVAGKRAIHLLTPFLLNRADGYDVIIDDIAHGVPWGSSFFTNRPVIGQVHHVHQEVLRLELNPFLGRLVALSERTIKYSYKTLIVVSESTKRALVENFGIAGNRIKVIPSGVDMEFYRPTMKSSSPTVLWVGRLKRYKRVEHILSAFRSVKKRLPTAKLVIVGDGDHTEALKNMAKTLGLSDVVFAGKVSEEKKAVFMASSWVAVSSSFIEGWGMTITECAACGTPAVAYDVPGLRDAIRNNETGLLVDNGNIKALAQALTRVLEDEKLRMRLSKNALHYTSEFSWDKVAKEFISFLELTKNRGYV